MRAPLSLDFLFKTRHIFFFVFLFVFEHNKSVVVLIVNALTGVTFIALLVFHLHVFHVWNARSTIYRSGSSCLMRDVTYLTYTSTDRLNYACIANCKKKNKRVDVLHSNCWDWRKTWWTVSVQQVCRVGTCSYSFMRYALGNELSFTHALHCDLAGESWRHWNIAVFLIALHAFYIQLYTCTTVHVNVTLCVYFLVWSVVVSHEVTHDSVAARTCTHVDL